MKIQEGLIPTALGTAVTATGALMKSRKVNSMVSAGVIGFGLAHVVLGTIDLIEHRNER
ncbi:MAG: asparagine synthase [Clostridiaceae bacterium]|nr:asparagine synthase [Clostridiaceae bacterium]